jgi:hypothetical protein
MLEVAPEQPLDGRGPIRADTRSAQTAYDERSRAERAERAVELCARALTDCDYGHEPADAGNDAEHGERGFECVVTP